VKAGEDEKFSQIGSLRIDVICNFSWSGEREKKKRAQPRKKKLDFQSETVDWEKEKKSPDKKTFQQGEEGLRGGVVVVLECWTREQH